MASKFEQCVIENSKLDDGPPVRYQLTAKKDSLDEQGNENLRRWTFGKSRTEANKTILLLGETGSGKSTLVNTMCNYLMGVKYEDKRWFEIVEDEKNSKPSGSKTTGVAVYDILGFEDQILPYSLTIIDTPGYGDTRGIQHDIIIQETLRDLFRSEKGVHEIDAVGLVLKATDNGLSGRLLYIFDSVVSLFGKDMEKNIVALITHSDGMPPTNALQALEDANIKCARNEKNQPIHFVFNNCLSTQITEDTEPAIEFAWRVTMRGPETFFEYLEKTTPQKLETTVKCLE